MSPRLSYGKSSHTILYICPLLGKYLSTSEYFMFDVDIFEVFYETEDRERGKDGN